MTTATTKRPMKRAARSEAEEASLTAAPAIPAPASASEVDLAALAVKIKEDLGAAKESRLETLRRFRSAGENLGKAKELCDHGHWKAWLNVNFKLSERQAQRYVGFSKTDVTSDLKEEERRWRAISGNA